MRTRYRLVLPLKPEESEQIWNEAVLTVDANVLLDLYRYHEDTRTRLFEAFGQFNGRRWLAHQAAEEFFRNRVTVIAKSTQDFDEAEAALKQLLGIVDRIRGYRLVPRNVVNSLNSGVKREVEAAREALKSARDAHPDYFTSDPLLEQILALFEAAVGAPPSEADYERLRKEGEQRRTQKVPPGFLDTNKDGDKALGDYFLWMQILHHARDSKCPIVFVTSEKKDDWWERHQGRTFPRRELLEEAARFAGQRILIYETEYFLERAAHRQGRELSQNVIAEIRAVGMGRGDASVKTVSASRAEAEAQVRRSLEAYAQNLLDLDEEIASAIAQTNAAGFALDDIEVLEVGHFDADEYRLPFIVAARFVGKHDGERMFSGDTVVAEISGSLLHYEGAWEVVDAEVTASVEDYRDDEER